MLNCQMSNHLQYQKSRWALAKWCFAFGGVLGRDAIRYKTFNNNDDLNQSLADFFESKPMQFYVDDIHVANADGNYLIDWRQI